MNAERLEQLTAARALVGKLVVFRHGSGGSPVRVTGADPDGLVQLSGYVGRFAPHLFTVVEEVHYARRCSEAEQVTGRRCVLDDGHAGEDHRYA